MLEGVVGNELVAEGTGFSVQQDPGNAQMVSVVPNDGQQMDQQPLACSTDSYAQQI